jgi:hypothetical protein
MTKITLVIAALALGGCTINGVTLDPNRSTASIAPDYLQLTPDEALIWEGLTDAQRQRAILFINNGSTLIASLGSQ